MTRWGLLPTLLAGCVFVQDADRDADRDGVLWYDDCDDRADHVFPGAPELCDGVDNDCDGRVDDDDEDIEDQRLFCQDDDGDGFVTERCELRCARPAGWVPTPEAGEPMDCDDSNGAVHPDAVELCDGVDNDCDGLVDADDPSVADAREVYLDADGDGHGVDPLLVSCAQTGVSDNNLDCDDTNSAVHPDAIELCDDGLDNDCAPDEGLCGLETRHYLADLATPILGPYEEGFIGNGCLSEDFNGDGVADAVVGLNRGDDVSLPGYFNGELRVLYGPVDDISGLDASDARVTLARPHTGFGNRVYCVGDVNGDGLSDLITPAPFDETGGTYDTSSNWTDAGAHHLLLGPFTGERTVETPDGLFLGPAPGPFGGEALTTIDSRRSSDTMLLDPLHVLPDLDGDGAPELFAGRRGRDGGAGHVWWVPLVWNGVEVDMAAEARLTLVGAPGSNLGSAIRDGGDLDGDGLSELLLAAGVYDGAAGTATGVAYLLFSDALLNASGTWDIEDIASARWEGPAGGDRIARTGLVNVGDVDGDGRTDLAIGANLHEHEPTGDNDGATWVILTPVDPDELATRTLDGDQASSEGVLKFIAEGERQHLGKPVEGPCDVNGDGAPDLLINAPTWPDATGEYRGAAYVFLGPLGRDTALTSAADAALRLEGDQALDPALDPDGGSGANIDDCLDMDGDGADELLLTANRFREEDARRGAVFLIHGIGY